MDTNQTIERVLGADRIDRHVVKGAANERAAATPYPGAAGAFLKGAIKAGEFTVRKIVLADWKIWQTIDSPFLRLFLEMQKPEGAQDEVNFTDDEGYLICWQFTRPVRDAANVVLEGGKESALDAAREQFFYEGGESNQVIITAVMEQFKRHMLTRLQYAAEQKESGEITFFPLTPTASDGQSTT